VITFAEPAPQADFPAAGPRPAPAV
jgi:hypothetical protein